MSAKHPVTRFLLPVAGGGVISACLAFFFASLAFLPFRASAQTVLNCNDWAIEVCEAPLPVNSSIFPDANCEDNCYRVYYFFYLVKSGAQSDLQTEQPFVFTSFSITGEISVTSGTPSVTGGGLSQVNLTKSVNCTPANYPGLNNPNIPNCPILTVEPDGKGFGYQISSNSPLQSVLSLSVYGRLPLFVLAVDVFPGETVEPTGLAYSFTLSNSSGTNQVDCNGVAQVCTNTQNLIKTISLPANSCTGPPATPLFRIGDADPYPTQGFPNRKRMPVWVSAPNSTFSWEEVDFLMSVSSGQSMLKPTIEGGLIKEDAIDVFAVGTGYRIYAHEIGMIQIQNGASDVPGSDNILFYIVFDGPQLESECAEATVSFTDYARLDGGDYICCKPMLGSSETAAWTATDCVTSHCPEIEIKAVHNSVTQSNNCGSVLYFDLYISSTQNVNLTDVRFALKVKKNGTFSLNTTATVSPFCSPSACISVTDISADYLRVEYEVSGINLTLFAVGSPQMLATIALNTSDNGCINGITFLDAVVFKTASPSGYSCLTSTESEFSDNASADDICAVGHIFRVSAETESGAAVSAWNYYVDYRNAANFPNCQYSGISPDGSTISRCVCILQNTEQNVVLKKADNYLNGVSTFDLVLISRHILGLVPLTGFNILAADANMNGSISTFDIVEFRKLILGIYTKLPHANSWRFIDKDLKSAIQGSSNPFPIIHTPDPNAGQMGNPNLPGGNQYANILPSPNYFADEEFDEFALPPTTNLDSKAEFVGFKVGDVNYSAIPSFSQSQTDDRNAGELALGVKTVEGCAGKNIEIPVFSLAQQSLVSWQMALGYDTNLLKINGVRWPVEIPRGAMQDRGWHLPQAGELRALWFDGEGAQAVKVGTPLFFVQAELLGDVRNEDARQLLHLTEGGIPQEAYDGNLRQYALRLEQSEVPLLPVPAKPVSATAPTFRLSAYPNPSGSHFRLEIEASDAAAVRLVICDIMGREIVTRPLDLVPGLNTVGAAQLPALEAGQYFVSLYTPNGVETLRLVKR